VLLLALAVNPSGAQTRPSATLAPIKIAVEAPLSGSQSSNGLDMLRGVQLAVREVNADNGVLGRRIEIIEADDKGDKANARRVASRVIKKNAVAVIGPYNSSVGIVNLPIYLKNRIVAIHLTSSDDTRGEGVTIQPKNSQIAPLEETYVRSTGAKKIAMLVDDTANGAFTIGMADRLQTRLANDGVAITRISIKEVTDNVAATYYQTKVAEALAGNPDLIYVSTYYPEGAKIAEALASAAAAPRCLMGLANVDPAFTATIPITASQRCLFSGVPAAPQLPSAKTFVGRYRKAFDKEPGVWGVFTYDSAKILFKAIRKAGTTKFSSVQRKLSHTRRYRGQTGKTSIDPSTGYRRQLPFLSILRVNDKKTFVIAM
jgi:branched-chain amino acid transport system substrate-binding protein